MTDKTGLGGKELFSVGGNPFAFDQFRDRRKVPFAHGKEGLGFLPDFRIPGQHEDFRGSLAQVLGQLARLHGGQEFGLLRRVFAVERGECRRAHRHRPGLIREDLRQLGNKSGGPGVGDRHRRLDGLGVILTAKGIDEKIACSQGHQQGSGLRSHRGIGLFEGEP